ncbi:3-isopropylmalate dehydratase large subunit [Herbaspirillum lusitanum]|uniref:3-isopropylmalate dehydratase large subunit n=1 Tax=Herbaspirillum lusitanum TaxID=213312 RepID=UPI002238F98E|nr:3-isopropylmalate dehydratase large subunit [Herbaspirillum lusitanum]MCW5297728.1 3-isopropylmalate dehydratase large subunit [Herbaspirillum lusitanum]
MPDSKTLFEKLWERHVVADYKSSVLLYIDKHLVNEVTSPQAFDGIRAAGRKLWRASSVVATADHNIPTLNRQQGMHNRAAQEQLQALEENCTQFDLTYFSLNDPRQGILHVVAPELGDTLPGTTIACGDSHTTTHGAFAALAFGVGTSDIEQVLATQTLTVPKLKSLRVEIDGTLPPGVYAKDVALGFIREFGTDCAVGHVLEFAGNVVSGLSMEARMTLCNMATEAGARAGLIAVDDITINYLEGRPLAPTGEQWAAAVAYWKTLQSDPGARYDKVLRFNIDALTPQITWGTTPAMSVGINESIPSLASFSDPAARKAAENALKYMGLTDGTPIRSLLLDKIFIGSCTNSRIEDLRVAAGIVEGKKVAANIRQALVVPGSGLVKKQAESEGLDKIFMDAGFEWRDAGCSMCLGMNNDRLSDGERCASTSNRNFEGRQGHGGRSHLVSPALAAASAIAGHFCLPGEY